jgi:hypothetical protein
MCKRTAARDNSPSGSCRGAAESDRHVGRRALIARSNDFEAMVASGIRKVREGPFHAGSVPVAICPHRTPPEFLAGKALGVRQGILSRGWKSRLRDQPA